MGKTARGDNGYEDMGWDGNGFKKERKKDRRVDPLVIELLNM